MLCLFWLDGKAVQIYSENGPTTIKNFLNMRKLVSADVFLNRLFPFFRVLIFQIFNLVFTFQTGDNENFVSQVLFSFRAAGIALKKGDKTEAGFGKRK